MRKKMLYSILLLLEHLSYKMYLQTVNGTRNSELKMIEILITKMNLKRGWTNVSVHTVKFINYY